MKIHYISAHSILEWDEVQLLTDLGHEVFSNGAYLDPKGHVSLPRPGLAGAEYYEDWATLARTNPKTKLPRELVEPFDLIIVMHSPEVIVGNWDMFKRMPTIWRTIGQSTPGVEKTLAPYRQQGLKIVRYSPKERNLDGYIGEDALIRFYKDENEYNSWNGANSEAVVNFSQSLKGRRMFCHYDEIFPVIEQFGGKVFGSGNDDLGDYNGGDVPYKVQNQIYRTARCLIYGGTWPASYTLSFIEALMTGLPIVAISKQIAHTPSFEPIDFYEVDELLGSIDGVVCDDIPQMIAATQELLNDYDYAKDISNRQRELALKLFSKEVISKQWQEYLNQFEKERL